MKTIGLIDTRSEVPGVSLGILVSTHPDVMDAFAANDLEEAEHIAADLRAHHGPMLTHCNSHFSFGLALDGVQLLISRK